MASKKQQIPIDIPRTGVRKDVNELIQTADMASIGENCIFFDGTIRPRPAMDVQVENYIGNWQLVLDGDVQADIIGEEGNCYFSQDRFVQANDGSFLLGFTTTARTFWVSKDGGITWYESALLEPGDQQSPELITGLRISSEYLFAYTGDNLQYSIWKVPIADLPDGGTWTLVVEDTAYGISTFIGGPADHLYDETTDRWITLFSGSFNDYIHPFVWVVDGCTTGSPTSGIAGTGEFYDVVNDKTTTVSPKILSPTLIAYTSATNDYINDIYRSDIRIAQISYDAEFVLTRDDDPKILWANAYIEGRPAYNLFNIAAPREDPEAAAEYCHAVGFVLASENVVTFMVNGGASSFYTFYPGSQFIGSVDLTNDFLAKIEDITYSDWVRWAGSARTTEKVIYAVWKINETTLPDLRVSSDDGITFLSIPTNVDGGVTYDASSWAYMNNVTDQHFFVYRKLFSTIRKPYVYLMPTSLGASSLGSITTLYQVDLDDEDDALVIGTTRGVARLESNEWKLITANQLETVPGSPGGVDPVDWNTEGDIPPLSVAPAEDEYVSGVSIEGVYGANPWVFRTFEAQGKTFLIGTNGQCYPIIYHPDMAPGSGGGFARRLGEVPFGDPNYNALAEFPTGNLAPRARCIANSANRLLLANNPNGSPFEVNVGAFNDPDRG